MNPSPQVSTYSSGVDSKSTATAIKPTMRSEFLVGLHREEQQQNGSLQVPKTLGCSWACYCCELVFSVSGVKIAYKYSYNKFRRCQSKYLGVFQILIGILCITANVAGIVMGAPDILFNYIGHGIWGGILMAVAGSFGVAAGKQKTKCMIVGMALWSIFASLAAAAIIGVTVTGIVTTLNVHDWMESQLVLCPKFLANYPNEHYSTSTYPGRWGYGSNEYDLWRYTECRRFMDEYREDTLYTEKLTMSIALVVLASVAMFLFLCSFVISVMPFSCCCGRDQESSDSGSEQEYNIIGTDKLIVTSPQYMEDPPQYMDDRMFSMPNTSDAHPCQSTNGPIGSSELAVIRIGGKSVEKLPLTDHV